MKLLARLSTALAVAALTSARDGVAQSAPKPVSVDSGPRVRITQAGVGRRTGLLLVLAPDSVVAEWPSGAAEAIPRSSITKLELSQGRKHFPVRGAAAGVVLGAGMGKLLAMSIDRGMEERNRQADAETCGPTPPNGCGLSSIVRGSWTNRWMLPLAMVSGAAGGAVLGSVGIERWRALTDGSSTRRVGVILDLSRDVAAIGLWRAL
jgi:hypothetical protein